MDFLIDSATPWEDLAASRDGAALKAFPCKLWAFDWCEGMPFSEAMDLASAGSEASTMAVINANCWRTVPGGYQVTDGNFRFRLPADASLRDAQHWSDLEVRYMEGQCHLLAMALAEACGWVAEAITIRDEPYPALVHAYAVLPDGRVCDIRGIRDIDVLDEEWVSAGYPRITIDWDFLMKWRGSPGGPRAWSPAHVDEARADAIKLIRLLELDGLEPPLLPGPKGVNPI